MEWPTSTLFLYRTELPDDGGCVEVIVEVWLGRRGDRNALGVPLEPDEAPELHLRDVAGMSTPEGVVRWQPHEKWLLEEAARRWNGKNRAGA